MPVDRLRGYHYGAFLRRMRFSHVYEHDPSSFPWRGLVAGAPRCEIHFAASPDVALVLGGETPEGGRYLLNETTERLYGIPAEFVPLLFPSSTALTADSAESAWEAYLR